MQAQTYNWSFKSFKKTFKSTGKSSVLQVTCLQEEGAGDWMVACLQQIFSKAESTFALNMSFNSVDSLSKYSEINPNVISGVILELLILDLF